MAIFALSIVVALGSVVTLGGCDTCGRGAACPDGTFGIDSIGRCIVALESDCVATITPYSLGCGDDGGLPVAPGGQRESVGVVYPPKTEGNMPGTCNVSVTLDDETKMAFSVRFTPRNSPCCGVVYDVSPPGVVVNSPAEPGDGGVDAMDDGGIGDDAMGDADAMGDS